MRTLCALLGVLCLSLAAGGRPVCALSFPFQEEGVELSIEPASGLEAGQLVTLTARVRTAGQVSPEGYLLLPYVNGRRWGAHVRTGLRGEVSWEFPLPPAPGLARIEVEAVRPNGGSSTRWIWTATTEPGQTVFFQKGFELEKRPAFARLWVMADDRCEVFLNGKALGVARGVRRPVVMQNLAPFLKVGVNALCISAHNGPDQRAGLAVQIEADGHVMLSSDDSWETLDWQPMGWPRPALGRGMPAQDLGGVGQSYWKDAVQGWPGLQPEGNLWIGAARPDKGAFSDTLSVQVGPCTQAVTAALMQGDQQVGVLWEVGNELDFSAPGADVPLVGWHRWEDPQAVAFHAQLLARMGVSYLLLDAGDDSAASGLHRLTMVLTALAQLERQGQPVPAVLLLDRTRPELNEVLLNPVFKGLWMDDGSLVASMEVEPWGLHSVSETSPTQEGIGPLEDFGVAVALEPTSDTLTELPADGTYDEALEPPSELEGEPLAPAPEFVPYVVLAPWWSQAGALDGQAQPVMPSLHSGIRVLNSLRLYFNETTDVVN